MNLRLEAEGLCKSYNGKPVIADCSFVLREGRTYALMGPNGCGKSTLFRICALIEEPDRGRVRYLSGDVTMSHDMSLRRKITLVLPKIGVFNTSVCKNVAYGLRVRGVTRSETARRVHEALEFVRLTHKKDQNALTLSSGETQRLGIARAIALEPSVLFLDEPTAFVDEKSKVLIEEIIHGIRRAGNALVVITTHNRDQAERLSDSVLMMADGRVLA
ncbi:MAG TPA: ABC transporter ATP-binding protein [Dissulfurispiraceae bacterium]|nr:ABC transporter ATP-binding protein [Dissulfurispiraceae bacterium]